LPDSPVQLILGILKITTLQQLPRSRVRFLKLSKVGLFAGALSLSLCFQPAVMRAEDEQGTTTPDETASEPARETPNFIPNQSQPAAASPTPVPTSSENQPPPSKDLGTGKFAQSPFNLSASVHGGYDDNVITTTTQGKPSMFVNPSAELDYKFGDARTAFNLRTGGGISYYFDRPGDQPYDVNAFLGLSAVHKASQRLTLNGVAYLTYQTEPDFSANVGTNRRSGNYFYSADKFLATYDWLPRFSTATSYDLVVVKYADSAIGQFEDRAEHTFENQFQFLLRPTTTLVADYRFEIVNYDNSPPGQPSVDSTTHFLLGGIDHKFDPKFTVSLRGGEQLRSFESGSDRAEPYFQGSLNYAAGHRTTVSLTSSYSLEEPGVAGTQSRTTFRTGLQTKYGFTQRVSGTVGFYFVHDDYAQGPPTEIFPGFFIPGAPAFTEDTLDVTLGLRFDINRNFAVDVGYGHTQVSSEEAGRDYSRNRYFGGLNFTF
jgi:hypothetical protein